MNASPSPLSTALPRLDPAAVRLHRLLSDARLLSRLSDAGIEARPALQPHRLASPQRLLLHGDAGTCDIEFCGTALPALAALAALAEAERRDAGATLLLTDTLDTLADIGWRVSGLNLAPQQATAAAASVLGLTLQGQSINLHMSEAGAGLLAHAESIVGEWPMPWSALQAQPLPSSLRIGSQALATVALSRLRRGDVLVGGLAAFGSAPPFTAQLQVGSAGALHGRAACTLHDREITMTHDLHLRGMQGDDDSDQEADTAGVGPVPVERLTFNVHFEIDGPAIALTELAQLSRGRVLELGLPVDQARIRIRVGGHTWAHGELVSVGGQLAVRITSEGGDDVRTR